jgi:hypothetical protein
LRVPVRPPVALEGRAQLRRQHLIVFHVLADAVVAGEVVERDVVLVHPFAGRDRARRKADDLAELAHRRALADRLDRHLVAARDALARGDARRLDALPDRVDGDDDVVLGRQAHDAGRGHGVPLFAASTFVGSPDGAKRNPGLPPRIPLRSMRATKPYSTSSVAGSIRCMWLRLA